MSWLVKLGKSPKSPKSNKTQKPTLSELMSNPDHLGNQWLKLNCNEFCLVNDQNQMPVNQKEFSKFSDLIKDDRDKRGKTPKSRKNIIFTQNNCFARAVAQLKETQRLKSTVRFRPNLVIDEADVEESIDVKECNRSPHLTCDGFNSQGVNTLTEPKDLVTQMPQSQNRTSSRQFGFLTPEQSQYVVKGISQRKSGQPPKQNSGSCSPNSPTGGMVTKLKCRIKQFQSKEGIVTAIPQNPLSLENTVQELVELSSFSADLVQESLLEMVRNNLPSEYRMGTQEPHPSDYYSLSSNIEVKSSVLYDIESEQVSETLRLEINYQYQLTQDQPAN